MFKTKEDIFEYMLVTRGKKYKWFLRALKSFKLISGDEIRGDFLESYYALMRYIDDVVDDDAPLPQGYSSSADFVKTKIDFAKNQGKPKDAVDRLMSSCFKLGQRFGHDFSEETMDILYSMLFDANRQGKSTIFPEKELNYHFHLLDIRGTIRASLKVFNEDPEKYASLEALGMASRIYYNLRDFDEDVSSGLLNISEEDMERFSITKGDLDNRLSEGVQRWFLDQSRQGLYLLKKHRENMLCNEFKLLTRITLPVLYEMPAKRYFNKIL